MTSWFSWMLSTCCSQDKRDETHPDTSIEVATTTDEDRVIETQPLSPEHHDNHVDHKALPMSPPRQRWDSQTIFCCANKTLREDQVDLCPRFWWNVRCSKENPSQPHPCADVCWRLCFWFSCLPLCYPCYLSRTIRRRGTKVKPVDINMNTPIDGIPQQISDELNQTMLRNVINMKRRCQSPGSDATGTETESSSKETVIQVNVVILQSPSSRFLQNHLYGSDIVDSPTTELQVQAPTTQRRKSVNLQPPPTPAYAPLLKAVQESTEDIQVEPSDAVPKITVTNVPLRRSSVKRRWSQLGTFGNTVARLSRGFSKPKDGDEIVEEDPEAESVRLRKDVMPPSNLRKFRKSSSVSGASLFFSFDEEFEEAREYFQAQEKTVNMKSIAQRIELVRDLGYQLSFSVFDEDSVTEWRGRDLRQTNEIPNVDLVVIAVKHGDINELNTILDVTTGMMSHLSKFWRGFYPLLLVELQTKDHQFEEPPEYQTKLDKLWKFFGDVHHIKILEDHLQKKSELNWVGECLARLFIHSRIYQCSRFFGHVATKLEKCPGGCGLRKINKVKLSRPRMRVNKFKSFYRKSRGPS